MNISADDRADLAPPLTPQEIAQARERISGVAIRTPLLASRDPGLWLKMELLQPYGSYKIRGATNAIKARLQADPRIEGVVTASAGNFGQSLTAAARAAGLPVTVHVPDGAARTKVAALRDLGATVVEHPFDGWWRIMQTRDAPGGCFIHPVCEREVIAGAATLGEEIVEDLPDVQAVLAPIGGGGLISGVAQAVRAANPRCRIIAVETATATPLLAAMQAGGPVTVTRTPSFVDGMGSTRILDEMWPLLSRLVDEVVVVTLEEVEAAIRRLVREHHVTPEGAGAAAFAAAQKLANRRTVAIVSGGNIDWPVLSQIMSGG